MSLQHNDMDITSSYLLAAPRLNLITGKPKCYLYYLDTAWLPVTDYCKVVHVAVTVLGMEWSVTHHIEQTQQGLAGGDGHYH